MVGRVLRRCVLVGALGLVVGSGVAWAEPTEQPDPVEQPRPLVAAAAACHDRVAEVKVFVYEDRDEPFDVTLASVNGPFSASRKTALDEEHFVHTTVFANVPVGEYLVGVAGADGPADGVRVLVKPCDEPGPGEGALTVEVECKAGWGIATFQVTNPKTGEVTSYTLTVDGVPAYELEVSPGMFLRVTENGYDDGRHTARLTVDGAEVDREEFTVACEKGNAARVDVDAKCAGGDATVGVGVRNPNRAAVDYEVTLHGQSKKASVGGGERAVVTFADVPDGNHPVLVTGSDQTDATTTVAVKCTAPTSTTTTTTTPATTTSTSTSTTSAAVPVPQGRSGGGLARTGSAVGEMVGLGALALVGGGVLVLLARRRRARHEGT